MGMCNVTKFYVNNTRFHPLSLKPCDSTKVLHLHESSMNNIWLYKELHKQHVCRKHRNSINPYLLYANNQPKVHVLKIQ